jgi:acetyl esterase/lipase
MNCRRKLSYFGVFWTIVAHTLLACVSTPKNGRELKAPGGFWNETAMKLAYGVGALKLIDRNPEIPDELEVFSNRVYKTVDTLQLELDVYRLRDTGNEPKPTMVFIHGGAWKTGKRSDYLPYLIDYAQKGYVTATVSYRLSRVAKFPAAVQDVNCAVRWLKAHAEEFGIDPDRMVLIGGSAGGHLSMMVGYAGEEPLFEPQCEAGALSSEVRAIVNLYGPTDLTTDEARGRGEPISFLGATYDERPDLFRQVSPRFYIRPGLPPTLIFHGTIDSVVPVSQADSLAVWLGNAGVPYDYHRLHGWPHTMDLSKKVNAYCQFYIDRFLDQHL